MQDKLYEQLAHDSYVNTEEYKQNIAREKAVSAEKKRKYISGAVKLRADAKVIRQADSEVIKSRSKFKNAAESHKRAFKKRRLNEREDDELCRQSNLGSCDSEEDSGSDTDDSLNIESPLARMNVSGFSKTGGRG